MGRLKEYYHEEICRGMAGIPDDTDIDYRPSIQTEVKAENLRDELDEIDLQLLEEAAERAEFDRIYHLTGSYPF